MVIQKLGHTLILAILCLSLKAEAEAKTPPAPTAWVNQWIDFGEEGYCAHSKRMKKRAGDTARALELLPDTATQSLIHCSIQSQALAYRIKLTSSIVLETTYADFWVHANASRISVWNYLGLVTIKNENKEPVDVAVLKPVHMLPIERQSQRLMAPTQFEMGEPMYQWKSKFQDLFRAEVFGLAERKEKGGGDGSQSDLETEPPPQASSLTVPTLQQKTRGARARKSEPEAFPSPSPVGRLRLFDPQRAITTPIDEENDYPRKK